MAKTMFTHTIQKKQYIASRPRHGSMSGTWRPQPAQVRQILRRASVQPKLSISEPNDKYEQEADRVANQVVRMADSGTNISSEGIDGKIQRSKESPGHMLGLPANLDPQLTTVEQDGQPLPTSEREFFEPRFNADFRDVRIHTDQNAQWSAQAIHAKAYTLGQDIVFGKSEYGPHSNSGRRLLAHELAHTIQQKSSGTRIDRQCDPAWAGLPWEDRVGNAQSMANGTSKDQCMADMIDEALTPNITVEQQTNTSPSVAHAINANRYTEWNTLGDLRVNYDRNLNAKTGNANQFGLTEFRTPPSGDSIDIYIMLGPRALNPVGPEHTQMAFHHESEHAGDFLLQFALIGQSPHAATAGEELAIYAEGFSRFFLDLWTIDNASGGFQISDTFSALFSNFPSATSDEQNSAFDSIQMFYDVRIQGIPCNEMKFKMWLQMMQNARPSADALVNRINALPGLGLTRGTQPHTHFDSTLGCS